MMVPKIYIIELKNSKGNNNNTVYGVYWRGKKFMLLSVHRRNRRTEHKSKTLILSEKECLFNDSNEWFI